MRRRLPTAVLALGAVSFLTDLSSEMIYPLLPVFLATVLGAGALSLGLIEGVAESTAALLKVFSGWRTDATRKRKPLILGGYALSGLVRPLVGLAGSWPFVLAMRFMDRVGKGLRTSPRDALIADVTPADMRGTAYGVNRALDHAGAVAGPLVAAALLTVAGLTLRHVFLLAAVPAVLAVAAILRWVREPPAPPAPCGPRRPLLAGWKDLGPQYRSLLIALLVFTLGNSTDAFLLLRLSAAGLPAEWVAVLWSLHHLVKMGATYAGGRLSDRLGPRTMVQLGWVVYAAAYLCFALVDSQAGLVAVFLAYGLYYGLTEPAEKAWVADLVPDRLRGTAFGFYHGTIGLAALPASLLFGVVWNAAGVPAAFLTGAALAAAAAVLVRRVGASDGPEPQQRFGLGR